MSDHDIEQQMNDEQAEAEDYVSHLEFLFKPRNVFCDICAAKDRASEKVLREKRWTLGRGFEFCPSH